MRNKAIRSIMILQFALLAFVTSTLSQYYSVDEIKGPVCVVRDSVTGRAVSVSPEISRFNVVITDGLANITLTQLFVNPFSRVNDIVYVFPLPHDGAVHAMSMEYNDMIYNAEIYEKTNAQQIYDSIKVIGGIAALLLQDRPNVFQQRLANIPKGDTAYIRIKVSVPLKYDNGAWELAIPTMVGERFESENSSSVPSSGQLWNPPEDRGGQSLQMNVLLQTGYPISDLNSPSHPLSITQLSAPSNDLVERHVISSEETFSMPYNQSVLLHSAQTYPNRDFVLRFSRAQSGQDFSLASFYDYPKEKGYFSLNCFPDDTLFSGQRPDLEIVLLIDISGSQSGWPLEKEKEIALNILSRLKTTDRLAVLSFNDYTVWGYGDKEPLFVTDANILKAKEFIQGLSVSGGTNLLNGVREALSATSTTEHSRYYVFLTDGFITNETAIFDEIKNHPTKPVVFTFGAGNNLNRYFLEQSALVGNGFASEIMQYQDVNPIVGNAWVKIESPQLKNVLLTISGSDVNDLLAPSGTSLYIGRPITIYGTYTTPGLRTVTVSGYRDGNLIEYSKTLSLADSLNCNTAIPKIWAKQKIEQLSIDEGITTENKNSIISISIKHQILSKYTAFLAFNPVSIKDGESIKDNFTRTNPAIIDRTSVISKLHLIVGKGYLQLNVPDGEEIVFVQIFDLKGRLIFSLKQKQLLSGHLIRWNGILADGSRLRYGKYIVKIKTTRRSFSMPIFWSN